jgi:DNA-binding protein YbaB
VVSSTRGPQRGAPYPRRVVGRMGVGVDNDALRHEVGDVLALVREQMRDLAVMQQERAALTATGSAADGTVEVSVDAQCVVTNTVVDESYLDEFELADLGGHVTSAARAAASEISRRSAELLAPLAERRKAIRGLSGIVADDAPEFGQGLAELVASAPVWGEARSGDDDDGGDGDGGKQDSSFPIVRR